MKNKEKRGKERTGKETNTLQLKYEITSQKLKVCVACCS